jgi:pyridoxamine 5'-phosphate oxidase family protein
VRKDRPIVTASQASFLTEHENTYLHSQPIGRLATVTPKARAHVVPVRFHLDDGSGTIEIALRDLPERGQNRFYRRNIENNPWVAIVVDDQVSTDPWVPRGIELRGRAEILLEGGERFGPGAGPVWIRIVPTWVSSWGIEAGPHEPPFSRAVG